MTDSGRAFAFQNGAGSPGLERAVAQGRRLLMEVEAFATMLAELGDIELPPAARAEPMQMRAVASLYLASALESAGLIDVADDFVRLMRSGVIRADIGEATDVVLIAVEGPGAGDDEPTAGESRRGEEMEALTGAGIDRPQGLERLAAHLKPGGIFGLWSDEKTDDAFTGRLSSAFGEAWAEPVTFHNPLQDRPFTQTVYLARKA